MATSDVCNLNKLIVALVNLATQYDEALLTTIHEYDGMANQVEQSLVESREYWSSFAETEQKNTGEQAAITIESIETYLTRMEALLLELRRIDHAFDRYYAKHQHSDSIIEEDLNENSNYLSIVRNLAEKLQAGANECSKSVKSFPFQTLEMAFSGKRKQQYATLIKYFSQAEQIADIACEDLPRKTSTYWDAVFANRDEEIAKAERESASLLAAIQNEKQEEIQKIIVSFQDSLDALLPYELITKINDYILSGKVDEKDIKSTFSPILPVGYYAHNLLLNVENEVIADILNAKIECLLSDGTIVVPAVFDATAAKNFAIRNCTLGYEKQAKALVNSLIFSMLANAPAGYQKFTLVDPEERTKSFMSMLDFVASSPEIMGERILTTQEQIRVVLRDLSAQIDLAAQKQFVGYSNIFEYNSTVVDKPEAYKSLIIMDFPKYFDEQMLDSLWNIVNSGNLYGVGVILQYNESFKEARASDRYYALLQKISQQLLPITENGGLWYTADNVTILPHEFVTSDFTLFANKFKEGYNERKKQGILFNKIIDAENIGQGDSTNRLSIPFAIDETGKVKALEFGDPVASGLSHYALVTGSTGSGKSTFLHTIIMSAIAKYSPDEINIYLMDFKKGTEFKIYAEKQVPQIKLLAMDAMQEFGQSILAEICSEMTRRAKLFELESMNTGTDIKNIIQYRQTSGKILPRLLVILDEFQLLFDGDANRKVAHNCGKMIADLVSLARVYGIHFIFATQTLSRIYSGNFTIQKASLNEMHVRIGLKGSEQEAELLFGSSNGKIAFGKYGEEKGLGAYIDDDTSGTPTGFKCAHCPAELQSDLLSEFAELYSSYSIGTRVFSGDYVPSLENSMVYKKFERSRPKLLLGEPVMIGDDLQIDFSNKKRTNLLIVGSNGDVMTSLAELSILSFSRFFSSDSELYYFDGEKISGDNLPKSTDQLICRNLNAYSANSEQDVLRMIDQIFDWYVTQKQRGIRDGQKRILVIIKNLQWIDSLNRILLGKSIDEYKVLPSTENPGAGAGLFDFIPIQEKDPNDLSDLFDDFNSEVLSQTAPTGERPNYRTILFDLVEYGYMYGINFVLGVSDFGSVKEYMYDFIPKFAERIIFGINDIDADRLIPEAKVQNLPSNIVLYTNGLNTTYQFKPFSYNTDML